MIEFKIKISNAQITELAKRADEPPVEIEKITINPGQDFHILSHSFL
jgi:hypothetical protein